VTPPPDLALGRRPRLSRRKGGAEAHVTLAWASRSRTRRGAVVERAVTRVEARLARHLAVRQARGIGGIVGAGQLAVLLVARASVAIGGEVVVALLQAGVTVTVAVAVAVAVAITVAITITVTVAITVAVAIAVATAIAAA